MKLRTLASTHGLSVLALAMPALPRHIPGDRLVANLTQRLKSAPKSVEIYYLIGRAHYATFSNTVESEWLKKGEVEYFDQENGLPNLSGHIYPWDKKTFVKDTVDNRRHVEGAIRNLRTALDLMAQKFNSTRAQPSSELAHLTLACTFESAALLAGKVNIGERYKTLTTPKQWREMAASEYLLAFQRTIATDSKIAYEPIFGLEELVSYEAGKSFLRLAPKANESPKVRIAIKKLEKVPKTGMVTPLIVDLSEGKSLNDLLEPTNKVSFDLDGTARSQSYSWVKPSTAFLVWDPMNDGKITSGRQLFGNATWWMLWDNAYAALDALDDNRDGWLSGKELKGLALWYDRNGNGRSDPGEVVPIEKTPIQALRTLFDGRIGDSYVSRNGVLLRSGQTLPTYDWVTTSIQLKDDLGSSGKKL